jgi:predicted PurR-regulated permease PerM
MNQPLPPTRVMLYTAAVLAVVGAAWLLIQVRSVVALFIVGVLFASAIEPLVTWLRKRGLTRPQAILTVYAYLVILTTLLVLAVAPSLLGQGSKLIDDVPAIMRDLQGQAAESRNSFVNTTVRDALERGELAWVQFRSEPPIEGQQAIGFVTSGIGAIFTVVTVLVVAFYWLTEKTAIKRLVLSVFPIRQREAASETWAVIEDRLGGWTRGQILLCLTIGVVSTIAYFLLGMPFWLALGILAGITEIVPFFGPFIGGGAAVIVALTDSWEKAIIVLVFVLALQQFEGAFLVPRVMRNAVGMSPLTVILAVLIGGRVGGPLGAILAIPVGAVVQVFVQVIFRNRLGPMSEDLAPIDAGRSLTGRAGDSKVPWRDRLRAREPHELEITPAPDLTHDDH